jgi:hypothetical protein
MFFALAFSVPTKRARLMLQSAEFRREWVLSRGELCRCNANGHGGTVRLGEVHGLCGSRSDTRPCVHHQRQRELSGSSCDGMSVWVLKDKRLALVSESRIDGEEMHPGPVVLTTHDGYQTRPRFAFKTSVPAARHNVLVQWNVTSGKAYVRNRSFAVWIAERRCGR